MKKTEYIQKSILVSVVILSLISLLVLPESVAVQWNFSQTTNYIPKFYAVLIPLAISTFGICSWKYSSVRYGKNIEMSYRIQTIHSVIWCVVSCIGIIINILFMLMNGKPVIL